MDMKIDTLSHLTKSTLLRRFPAAGAKVSERKSIIASRVKRYVTNKVAVRAHELSEIEPGNSPIENWLKAETEVLSSYN